MNEAFLKALEALLGPGRVLTDLPDRIAYGSDNSRRFGLPLAVAFAEQAEELPEIVQLARRHRIPITPRGRATATTGAAVPSEGGLVLSFERMNGLLEIDPTDRIARVAPGVLNADLQAAAAAHGLFWPPDPTSAGYATIGGNLACNAGGPRTLKYGQARLNTLALTAVDGCGRSFRTGAHVRKRAAGYDLVGLLVGSEGTLALISEATLALRPLPPARGAVRALYGDASAAVAAVVRVLRQPVTPTAIEYLDPQALALARRLGGAETGPPGALLLVEADGDEEELPRALARLSQALTGEGLLELQAEADCGRLWEARRKLSPALRQAASGKINEDVVLPIGRLVGFAHRLEALSAEWRLPILSFGHIGDGNLHVNILFEAEDRDERMRAESCAEALMQQVLALGGALSGEHGIGLSKRPFLAAALDPMTATLWRELKRVFDPDGILNPGKLLPD
ncbi:MAG: lactate dehydrogenase [Lysobacterales bacterium]|nr:MAG: lactate dehydrogenase [Xanthomonadales bacterium]